MYSAILEGKAATWFRAARTRSWFATVLILVLCALALSACGSGGNGGGEAGGNAMGEGSSAPVEFEYGNEVEHWNVACPTVRVIPSTRWHITRHFKSSRRRWTATMRRPF